MTIKLSVLLFSSIVHTPSALDPASSSTISLGKNNILPSISNFTNLQIRFGLMASNFVKKKEKNGR